MNQGLLHPFQRKTFLQILGSYISDLRRRNFEIVYENKLGNITVFNYIIRLNKPNTILICIFLEIGVEPFSS